MTRRTDTHRMHGRRAIEALWQAARRLCRKTVLAAILASILGLTLVSLLLDLSGRNGDLVIAVAALLVLLLLVKPVLLLDRLLRRHGSVAAPHADASVVGDASHRTRPEPTNEPSASTPPHDVLTNNQRTKP